MPNWCYTDYVIEGDKKELQTLYETLQRLDTKTELKTTSGFGGRWLGNLVTELGGDWEKIYCRGSIDWYDMEDDQLKILTETAWGPMTEVFDFITEKFPSLTYYYQAEEPGCELYWSNDTEGLHFYKYVVRLCKDGYDECEYFETQEEAFEYISKNFNTEIKSFSDVEHLNEMLEEKEKEDYCYLNEFVNPA